MIWDDCYIFLFLNVFTYRSMSLLCCSFKGAVGGFAAFKHNFYVKAATPYTIVFVITSSIIAYVSTIYIEHNRANEIATKTVSTVAIISVLLNIVIWFLLKGSSFWILGSALINRVIPAFPLLKELPLEGALGMGYYTAQVIGYILDVLWQNAETQKNPLKLFLFVCFFHNLRWDP